MCAGFIRSVTEFVENGAAWVFWVLLGVLLTREVLALLLFPLMGVGPGLRRRA